MPAKVLYITYDGLTDPLGQSQIVPYLKGLSYYGYEFTILSFEKKERFLKGRQQVEKLLKASNINWEPLPFTSRPPLLSKFYDALRMQRTAYKLQRKHGFQIVHCRSYVAADAGLHLKKKFGVKFIFDMRGFWADEKKDGSWNVSNPLFKKIYQYYKRKESQYLQYADYIISLTHAGRNEMLNWAAYNKNIPVQVIPCCADMDLFSLTNSEEKKLSREQMRIPNGELLLSYLGSIGTWYMLDEMLLFFKKLKAKYPGAKFLFVTHSPRSIIESKIEELELSKEDFIIREAARNEVPFLIKASDINISFIKPVYSKISSSPTKLGEVLSMGIPIISNSGVGDVKSVIESSQAGYVIDSFNEQELEGAIEAIPALLKKSPANIRNAVKDIYSLERGIDLYLSCYKQVLS